MNTFYKIARGVVYPFFRWFHPVRIIGAENIPQNKAYILCSNHTSNTDPFFLATVFREQIFFMSKIELFKIPVIKQALTAAGAFAVDRGRGDMSAIKHAVDLIKQGKILGIFPEGTRYKTGAPRKAKSGIAYIAMNTQAAILPMSIYREGRFTPFKRTTIRIGELIGYNELVDIEAKDRANIKNIVDRVTNAITELWELKH